MKKNNLNPKEFLDVQELSAIENMSLVGGRERNVTKIKIKCGCDK